MDFGSAIFDNEEQARRDERRAYDLNSESESDMYSQDEDDEEDHAYIFDDDVPSERICASHARRDYGVTRDDLAMLEYTTRVNPYYRSAAPMRLYLRTEVIKLAKETERLREIQKARKEKDAEKAAIQRKAEAKKAREDAKITVASFRQFSNAPANSGLSMVWQIALPQLVAVMCKHNTKVDHGTAQEVFNELTNLALTCQEMSQLVIEIGLPALEERLNKTVWERFAVASGPDGRLPPLWDKILRTPKSCSVPELKDALKQLKLSGRGGKDELILRIYDYFGMKKPCPKQIPAGIAFAVRRQDIIWTGLGRKEGLLGRLKGLLRGIPDGAKK